MKLEELGCASVCPKCKSRSLLKASGIEPWSDMVYRERVCSECGHLWKTYEVYEDRIIDILKED